MRAVGRHPDACCTLAIGGSISAAQVWGGLLFAVIAKSLELRTQHRAFHHHSAHLARGIIKLIRDRSVLRPEGAARFDRALSAGKQDVIHGARV